MPSDTGTVPARRESAGSRSPIQRAWTPFWHLREEIEDLFDDFYASAIFDPFRRRRHEPGHPARSPLPAFARGVPMFDVIDSEREIRVCAELPGMDESDIEVRATDSALTVRGEKREERGAEEDGGSYYLSERRFGSFQRTIPLPEGVDRDGIEASFRKGVLTVRLPKKPEAQPSSRKIEVKGKD